MGLGELSESRIVADSTDDADYGIGGGVGGRELSESRIFADYTDCADYRRSNGGRRSAVRKIDHKLESLWYSRWLSEL